MLCCLGKNVLLYFELLVGTLIMKTSRVHVAKMFFKLLGGVIITNTLINCLINLITSMHH